MDRVPLELAGYGALYVGLREVAEYKYGSMEEYRTIIADVTAVAVMVLGILPGFLSAANMRWFWAEPDLRHESSLIITHIAVAVHNAFLLRRASVSVPLLLCGLAVSLHEFAGVDPDGALHRIMMAICLASDASLATTTVAHKFPNQAALVRRGLRLAQLVGAITIIFFEIINTASFTESWHLFPALVAVNWMMPVEEIFGPEPAESPVAAMDHTLKRIAESIGEAVRPAPMLRLEAPRLELEDDGPPPLEGGDGGEEEEEVAPPKKKRKGKHGAVKSHT